MIEVKWDNDEKTIIYGKFMPGWTLQHVHDLLKEVSSLADTVEHPVYVIADLSDVKVIPSQGMAHFRSISVKMHPRIRLFIDVTDSMFVEAMTNIFTKMFKTDAEIRIVKTLDKAYTLIEADLEKNPIEI